MKNAKLVSCLLAVLLTASSAFADDYPSKPIRLIVPVPPGAGPDVDARQITTRMQPLLGQPIIVDNRPGASTRIAIEAAAKAAPDGYTFLLATPSFVTASSLYAKLPFDTKRDFAPVSLLSTTSYLLTVNGAVPAKSAADYVALAKTNARYAQVATLGVGTLPHLAGAWFGTTVGADLKFIHYNTTAPYNDLLSGETTAMFEAMLPVMGNLKSGKLRALAISGTQRHPLLPEVPTFAEAGFKSYDPVVWVGVVAPAGTPRAMIDKVSAALAKVAKTPEIIGYRRDVGSESVGSTPEEFGAYIKAEIERWGRVIKAAGFAPQ